MIEFLAALVLDLEGQTKVLVGKNKHNLPANVNVLTNFFRTLVFNNNIERHYGFVLKNLSWAIKC